MTDTKPEQPASILAQIGTTLLSSYKVLALVRRTPFHQPLNLSDLREAVYLGYLPWSARLPDHVFEHSWQLLAQQSASKNSTGILTGALGVMADEFLEPRHGNLHVKQQKFGAWQQSIVSRMSGIPLLAAAHSSVRPHAWLATETHTQWPWEPPRSWASKNLPVISPYDPLVEDYLGSEGLNETHLHLNGSTHAENCWLRALRRPKQEVKDFSVKWHTPSAAEAASVRELTRSIDPDLSPAELHRQLVAAGPPEKVAGCGCDRHAQLKISITSQSLRTDGRREPAERNPGRQRRLTWICRIKVARLASCIGCKSFYAGSSAAPACRSNECSIAI